MYECSDGCGSYASVAVDDSGTGSGCGYGVVECVWSVTAKVVYIAAGADKVGGVSAYGGKCSSAGGTGAVDGGYDISGAECGDAGSGVAMSGG